MLSQLIKIRELQSELTVKDNGVKEENNPVQRVRVRDPSALGGD